MNINANEVLNVIEGINQGGLDSVAPVFGSAAKALGTVGLAFTGPLGVLADEVFGLSDTLGTKVEKWVKMGGKKPKLLKNPLRSQSDKDYLKWLKKEKIFRDSIIKLGDVVSGEVAAMDIKIFYNEEDKTQVDYIQTKGVTFKGKNYPPARIVFQNNKPHGYTLDLELVQHIIFDPEFSTQLINKDAKVENMSTSQKKYLLNLYFIYLAYGIEKMLELS